MPRSSVRTLHHRAFATTCPVPQSAGPISSAEKRLVSTTLEGVQEGNRKRITEERTEEIHQRRQKGCSEDRVPGRIQRDARGDQALVRQGDLPQMLSSGKDEEELT